MPRNETKAGGALQKYPNWLLRQLPSSGRGHGHEPATLPCQNLATDKGKPLISPQSPCKYNPVLSRSARAAEALLGSSTVGTFLDASQRF